jgi:hypothetical protein
LSSFWRDVSISAIRQGDAVITDDHRTYNRLYRQVKAIDDEFRARGPIVRRAIVRLFDDPNPYVRLNAGIWGYAVDPERAQATLQALRESNFLLPAADAGMFLRAIEKGEYTPS